MKKIYFDHSATTPVDKEVLKAMMPYFSVNYGNPSSIHAFGQAALYGVDQAREQVAKFLNSLTSEIIFTSGATESDNLAINGLIKAIQKKGIKNPHIITTIIEHDAVLEPCLELKRKGVEVTLLNVTPSGIIDIEKFRKSIKDNTVLVSIMYVNSEVGSIQPIKEIGKIIKNINEQRLRDWKKKGPNERSEKPQRIYFHTDATQAINFLPCDVEKNYIDLLSLSGHKIYGPKGVGVLYVRSGTPLEPLQLGGHHEKNLRSGTLSTTGIVGLGKAISLLTSERQKKENKKIAELRDFLVAGVQKKIFKAILNTDREKSTPAHAHFSFIGAEGESILISLDLAGIAVSTGSACASGSLKTSRVLLAMGIKEEICHSSIRFTLGKNNTRVEIKKLLQVLPSVINRLRKMSPEKF